MLTSFTSDEAMLDAILAGASGYVVKDIKGMELAEAIKDVGAGRSLLDNRAAAALMAKLRGAAERSDPLSGLTEQERVLLGLLGEGLTNKQIAARMFLAEKTVKKTTCHDFWQSSVWSAAHKPRCSSPNSTTITTPKSEAAVTFRWQHRSCDRQCRTKCQPHARVAAA